MKNKTLLNPTASQVKYRNRLWAEALMKNKKKANNAMYCDSGRCCLAVAQDVAIANGVNIPKNYEDGEFPHIYVKKFFGWSHIDPILKYPTKENVMNEQASYLNDYVIYSANSSTGMSHERIAECVLNTFVHPSKKKWSFQIKE